MNPALQFLARFLSATVQVLSKSGSTCASLGDGPNIIRKAETYGRSPLQLESSYINPSPKSHNPPPPLILRSHSFSWSETLTSICVALQEVPSCAFAHDSRLCRRRVVQGALANFHRLRGWLRTPTTSPERPRGWPPAGFLTGEAAHAPKANQQSLRIVRCPFLEPVSVINRPF